MTPENSSSVLTTLLNARHSCRAFLPDPVPRPVQEQLLQMAQRTASWCNSQPWQIHITEDAGTERLRQALGAAPQSGAGSDFPWPREYQGVYQERRRECGFALYDSVGIARGDRDASARQAQENFRLFGAPHVAIITSDEALGVYGAVDCGAYVANFLLAAASLGVATIPQAALASRSALLREFFGLRDDRRVVCGISFGYADAAHPANGFRTRRADVATAAAWVTQ
ncbi:nitroreductase [Acidovorax sp.]|uniref:nitroreductase n=1 Tax=Acidovorax sp. TaxID=1872122 RepID=UPI002ACD2EA0|nr:nitroreductase [Acidovorax sp.]MDZ7864240.1 nitroreductase [Acidovorax sp.]